eukprot:3248321-Rhodomonas_salina.1
MPASLTLSSAQPSDSASQEGGLFGSAPLGGTLVDEHVIGDKLMTKAVRTPFEAVSLGHRGCWSPQSARTSSEEKAVFRESCGHDDAAAFDRRQLFQLRKAPCHPHPASTSATHARNKSTTVESRSHGLSAKTTTRAPHQQNPPW